MTHTEGKAKAIFVSITLYKGGVHCNVICRVCPYLLFDSNISKVTGNIDKWKQVVSRLE